MALITFVGTIKGPGKLSVDLYYRSILISKKPKIEHVMRWPSLLSCPMLRIGFNSENHHGKHCAYWY
jgi:hypothetical protein